MTLEDLIITLDRWELPINTYWIKLKTVGKSPLMSWRGSETIHEVTYKQVYRPLSIEVHQFFSAS